METSADRHATGVLVALTSSSPSLHAAWDVTTVEEVWKHVERKVFAKRGGEAPNRGCPGPVLSARVG
jgi:hypothetical protein